jgi:hypothetical protein
MSALCIPQSVADPADGSASTTIFITNKCKKRLGEGKDNRAGEETKKSEGLDTAKEGNKNEERIKAHLFADDVRTNDIINQSDDSGSPADQQQATKEMAIDQQVDCGRPPDKRWPDQWNK